MKPSWWTVVITYNWFHFKQIPQPLASLKFIQLKLQRSTPSIIIPETNQLHIDNHTTGINCHYGYA